MLYYIITANKERGLKMNQFKCRECGFVFEEPSAVYEPHGERFSVCPSCGSGDCDVAHRCGSCFEFFIEDELHSGMCQKCVMDSATYENMVDFLVDQKWLFDFVFVECLGAEEDNLPTMTEKHIGNVGQFILGIKKEIIRHSVFKQMKKFIFADNDAIDDFAKFLEKRGD